MRIASALVKASRIGHGESSSVFWKSEVSQKPVTLTNTFTKGYWVAQLTGLRRSDSHTDVQLYPTRLEANFNI